MTIIYKFFEILKHFLLDRILGNAIPTKVTEVPVISYPIP